jgi:D-sedoheptulose 7-phosphate isomerase
LDVFFSEQCENKTHTYTCYGELNELNTLETEPDMEALIRNRIKETINNLNKLFLDEKTAKLISNTANSIVESVRSGNKLMICGNGGSAADAQHMAGEFLCRFYKDREPLPAIALTTDVSVLTSISNDYSYDDVFSRQVKALGKSGDILLGISTSGASKNVLNAFMIAREKGIKTVLLTGNTEKEIAQFSDIVIKTPSTDTPRIQEMHLIIEHIICEIVENELS